MGMSDVAIDLMNEWGIDDEILADLASNEELIAEMIGVSGDEEAIAKLKADMTADAIAETEKVMAELA